MSNAYKSVATFLALVGLYLACTAYATNFARASAGYALFWPAAGLAYAAAIRLGLRWVLLIPVGALLDHLLRERMPWSYVGIATLGDTLSILAGAWIGRRGRVPAYPEFRSAYRMLAGAVVAAVMSAVFGTAAMLVAGMIHEPATIDALVRWSMGNLLGITAVAPALVLFSYRKTQLPSMEPGQIAARKDEQSLWNIALLLSFLLMGWGASEGGRYPLGLSSLPLAVMVWGALRFEPLRTAVAVLLTVTLIGSFAGLGLHGFEPSTQTLDYAMLLSYLCVLSVLPVTLALVVNEGRIATRKLLRRATVDPLSGLPNRPAFETAVRRALANPATPPLALCYFDLDNIKLVNDTASHAAGDALIVGIAGLINASLQEGDALAHFGGDEFALLLHNVSPTISRDRTQTLVRSIEAYRCNWEGRMLNTTASAGVVPFRAGEAEFAGLLSQADAACYTAKEQGGNRVCLAGAMPGDVLDRTVAMRWAVRIREAIDRRAFSLYAQSMLPLHAGLDTGRHFEILLRMHDSDSNKHLTPNYFMPAAERFRLGVSIDRMVVGMTLDWLESHPVEAATISTCAINLCGEALVDEPFIGFVLERLSRSSFPASRICLEITETSAVRDLGRAQRFIDQLRGIGCRFSLDDFGTGFCSFSYLRSLDVDYFKIDGSFVREMHSSPLSAAVVRSITQIAHVLHKQTIAEHSESETLIRALTEQGVDYGQGYAIDRPQPLAEYFARPLAVPRFDTLAVDRLRA
ncbi:MAG: EAL domain-containing protein [Proteobacteria bacterium]|nr:EAL domain-containing protein [Pseudomonadota bacterium]